MLLKEHCCEYKQGRQGIGTPAYHLMLLQRLAVIEGYAGPQRVIYMKAWQNIGRSICLLKHLYHIHKNIIPGKVHRTQIQAVRN